MGGFRCSALRAPILYSKTLALWAFAYSWLEKGRTWDSIPPAVERLAHFGRHPALAARQAWESFENQKRFHGSDGPRSPSRGARGGHGVGCRRPRGTQARATRAAAPSGRPRGFMPRSARRVPRRRRPDRQGITANRLTSVLPRVSNRAQ